MAEKDCNGIRTSTISFFHPAAAAFTVYAFMADLRQPQNKDKFGYETSEYDYLVYY